MQSTLLLDLTAWPASLIVVFARVMLQMPEAWSQIEAGTQRSFACYVMTRFQKNPTARYPSQLLNAQFFKTYFNNHAMSRLGVGGPR